MDLTPPCDDERVDLDEIDLLDARFYATGRPHAVWQYLRRHEPVYEQRSEGDRRFWVVTRYADVCRVLKNYEEFTSRRGTMLCIVDTGTADIASDQMLPDSDPPLHTRLRIPVARALTSRAIESQGPRIRQIAEAVLASAREEDEFDFAAAVQMFPMAFTGSLMGLPEEDFPRLARLTAMTIAYRDPELTQDPPQLTLRHAHHELFSTFAAEIARRSRSDPGDDLIGVLMSMTVDGKKLTDSELIFNCYSLLLGANVTTPSAAAATVLALAERPDEFRRWRANPDLLESGVEEGLRWSSPASHSMRYAVRDVEMHGRHIAAGDAVSVWLGSANRDEEVFAEPFRFDVARNPNRHVALGFGPHYCIGAPLARSALQILFRELLASFVGIDLVGPVEHLVSTWTAGIKHMPVRMEPRAARRTRMRASPVGGSA